MDEAQIYNFLEALKSLVASGKYDKAIQGCKAVLQQSPGNTAAAELLAEAERRKAMYQQQGGAALQARQYKCPGCGGAVAPHQADSQAITCQNCHSILDLSSGEAAPAGDKKPIYAGPRSFLKLGMEGMLEGKKVQLIGRLRYQAEIREWDTEDNDWWKGSWNWDEWTVVTEDKEYLYLEEDDEGYKLHRKFTPQKPGIPERNARSVALDDSGIKYNVLEHGDARLTFFEGEFTWLPKLGERVCYCDTDGPQGTYSIEWRIFDGQRGSETEEVEFFSGSPIKRLQLLYAFDQRELIAEENQKKAAQAEFNRWSTPAFITAIVLLLAGIYSLSAAERTVFQHSEDFVSIPEDGVTVGPFQLDKPGSIYEIRLKGSIPDNSDSWAGVELLDSAQDSINAAEGDIWSESGSDDEGPWTEASTESNMYFRLDNPGVYYARMFIERGNAAAGTVSMQIVQGISLSRFYFVGSLLAAGFGVAMRRFRSANPLWIFLGILLLGAFLLRRLPAKDDD